MKFEIKRTVRRGTWLKSLLATAALSICAVQGASAATLQLVSGFGTNPGAWTMYKYVPMSMPSNAPVVVLLHGLSLIHI